MSALASTTLVTAPTDKMTIMTIVITSEAEAMNTRTWTVAEAKAKFSEVIATGRNRTDRKRSPGMDAPPW
jgi:hypothetical protein